MDILTSERPVKLGHQYLSTAADQEKLIQKPALADAEDLFPIQVEDTCLIALATAYNARESEGGTTKQELLHFVEECFELPVDKLKQLKKRAQASDKPEFYLKCKILRASGLTPKDVYVLSGLRNPYCRLGILNEVHSESHTVKQKDLELWKKEGLVESVVSTKVKLATLEPEWNEDFHLSVSDPSKELLVLEVWDGDEPAEKGGNIIKGILGIGTYIAEKTIYISKGGDFMGRLFYPLRSIPNFGEEKTFALYSHSGRTQRGYVTLHLSIKSKKKNPLEVHLLEYTALTHVLVSYNTRKDGKYVRNWSGMLTPMAKKLLEHHAQLNDIDSLQQACIRFSVLIKYHKLYTVDKKVIWDLIRKLKEYHIEFSTPGSLPQWKKQLFIDLSEFSEMIQGALMNHLNTLNISSKAGIAKIEEQVKSLCMMYSFWPFTKQLPPESASLKVTLESCIKVAVGNWFHLLDAYLLQDIETDMEHLIAFVSLSENCLDQCGRTLKFLHPIFLEAGVDYFSVFFIALDKLLCREAESRMAKCGVSSETSTFAIYRSFVEIHKMMKYVNKSKCDGLSILNFHKWLFKDMVNDWIRAAIAKCKDLIAKAIAADSWITVTNDAMFSSSALDTTGFLLQVCSFWKHLEWPVASEAYGYAISVVKGISQCALFYMGEVFENLSHGDIFDKRGQFRATDKVCTVLNNMQHIRQELSQFEEKLELQSFCDWLEVEEKLGGPFKEVVKKVLASADEDMFEMMNGIVIEIVDKLSSDIQAFIHSLIARDGMMNDEEAADPLLEYLHHNLQTFVSHLYPAVLKNILHHVWRVSVESVDLCLGKAPSKKGTDSAQVHQRLFTILKTMRDFYHCGGNGLDDKDLDSKEFMTLHAKLDILRLPTEKLILHFFSDLAQHQREEVESGKAELGTLLISVGYLKQSSLVEVDVIQGKNLPGFRDMYKSGLSDPFVQLTLMPSWIFSESSGKCFKTTVQKRTLNPFFNETFKLPTKQREIDIEGTVLLLSIFDSDVVGVNDFAGMCVVACKDIPQLVSSEASLTDPNTPQRKNLTLPLFRYTSETQLAELSTRAHLGDTKASDFFKVNKKLLGHLSHPWYHLSSKMLTVKLANQNR